MEDSIYSYVLGELGRWKGRWAKVSKETGISKRTIEKIASRSTKNPGVKTVEQLAEYFREQERKAAA